MVTAQSPDSLAFNRLFGASFVVLLLVAIASILDFKDLWFTDEARVAGISIQMSDRQLYSMPYLGTEPFVEKPPLYFVSAALSYSLFGEPAQPAWSLRLASLWWGLLSALACGALVYTLARQYSGRDQSRRRLLLLGLAAGCILFALPGFVKNALTVRVDIALVFFYVATLLCACRWLFSERLVWLYCAALMLSMALLSKGLVGPALVGCSLLALLPEILQRGAQHWRQHGWHYVIAFGLFLMPVGIWLLRMYAHGGTELLSFWLFDNQLSRFSGGGRLGHEEPGQLFYYLGPLAEYLGPWVLFFIAWIVPVLWRALRRQAIPGEDRVLLLFFLLPVLLLSAASTKRPVYLIPLLPLCAAALAFLFARPGSASLSRWSRLIGLACVLFVMSLALVALLPVDAPGNLGRYINALGPLASVALLVLGPALAWLIWQLQSGWKIMVLGVCYVMVLLSYGYYPALNQRQGQHDRLQAFLAPVSAAQLQRSAGWRLSEALRGYLYAYTRRGFEPLSGAQVVAVLGGEDERYRCVLYSGELAADLPPHRVVSQMAESIKERRLALLCRD
jgi:4-amino-4-deoxy-L-arabinose transferase-like glycosyltransferase